MLTPNEVCSLFVDQKQKVWGLRLCFTKKGVYNVVAYDKIDISETTSEEQALSQLFNQLEGYNYPTVITSALEGMICLDIPFDVKCLPPQEMALLIEEELSSYFPGDLNDYVWQWRVVSEDADNNCCVVRIVLVQEQVWQKFLNVLLSAKVKLDLFVHPFLTLEPLLSQSQICLSAFEPDLTLLKMENKKGRGFIPTPCDFDLVKELSEKNHISFNNNFFTIPTEIQNILLLNALFTLNSNKQPDGTLLLLNQMRPRRGRFLYFLAVLGVIIFTLLGTTLIIRDVVSRVKLKKELSSQLKTTRGAIDQIKRQINSYKDICSILDSLDAKKKGNQHIIDFLYDLSRAIPDTMRCSVLRFTDPTLDITIIMPLGADSTELMEKIEGNHRIKVVKRNQTDDQRGGMTLLRLTLNYNYEGAR